MTTAAKMLPTLISAIKSSLDAQVMVDDFEECLLTSDRMRVRHRAETEYWDYKEILNLTNDTFVARLARDVLGFHNASGGVLIVGVTDQFHITGLAPTQQRDATFLRQKLAKYIGNDIMVFQDAIVLRNGRIVWLIFIPSRGHAHPRACLTDGPPVGANGQREVRKNGLYQRRGDQIISCEKPEDLDRLYTGYSPSELHAYTYEIDEPYIRLLAPDFEEFVGREQIVSEIMEAFDLRHPILALDGLGGAGKTATAIHVVKRLSVSGRFVFIISLSAKNRIWQGEQRSRRASFSGFAEFLRAVATVLLVPQTDDLAELEELVIESMRGSDGLILIDNLEEIDDADLTHFITRRVPAPVKVFITSRVAKGWGAMTISVPEMDPNDAEKL
ncbi:MAG TPA: RNA-binding domain-containing protein, partial [Thermoanaerobaculia bacterium]|nr:RNA-binding domain-containing protein [Thermoanaerobaculia bacterium]